MGNNFFIHESSYLDGEPNVGEGTKIWHFSHVQSGAVIGKNCVIGQNVNISGGVIIGDNVKIQNNVSLYSGLIVEDEVFIGPSVVFTNVINPRAFVERKDEFKKTLIQKGASLGANSTILGGTIIGEYSFVGAGSVVTKDVYRNEVVVGVPACRFAKICCCGNIMKRNNEDIISIKKCLKCGYEI